MAKNITRQIPITPFGRAVDNPSDSVWCEDARDGYFDKYDSPDGPKLVWKKRPGLVEEEDLSDTVYGQEIGRVDGLYYWDRQNILITVDGGRLRYISENLTKVNSYYETAAQIGKRPYFADVAGTHLYITSGGKIGQFTPPEPGNSFGYAVLTDGDAPTSVKSVSVLDTILIGLRADSERFDWADAGTPTVWAGEYSNAQSKPDLNKNAISLRGYYHIFGSQTYEPWRFDGSTFVRESGAVLGVGLGAADTLLAIDDIIYFIDNNRNFCRLSGFQVEVLSSPSLSRYVQSFDSIDDAVGMYLRYAGKQFYIVSFSNENKTLVYDIGLNTFYEWGWWRPEKNGYDAWRGRCVANIDPWGVSLCGDTYGGRVYSVGGETDNGDEIRTVLRTGEIDHGYPDINKFSSSLTAVFKRSGTAATPKNITIRWRNNGRTVWEEPMTMQCEEHGTTSYVSQIRRLGHYKTRTWEIVMPESSASSIMNLTETFSVGR